MKYIFRDDTDRPVMEIGAKNERDAWAKIRKFGIRNNSNIFSLVRV